MAESYHCYTGTHFSEVVKGDGVLIYRVPQLAGTEHGEDLTKECQAEEDSEQDHHDPGDSNHRYVDMFSPSHLDSLVDMRNP